VRNLWTPSLKGCSSLLWCFLFFMGGLSACAERREGEKEMNAEYLISGIIALLLLLYLMYALLKPEKF
jgi:K+-transporting ATPase KdpF subunit